MKRSEFSELVQEIEKILTDEEKAAYNNLNEQYQLQQKSASSSNEKSFSEVDPMLSSGEETQRTSCDEQESSIESLSSSVSSSRSSLQSTASNRADLSHNSETLNSDYVRLPKFLLE